MRDEELAAQFSEALRAMQLDDEVLDWVTTALRQSHQDARRYPSGDDCLAPEAISAATGSISRMYIDKLDGSISQDYFDRMGGAFQKERDDILRKIEQYQTAHQTYLEEGIRLLGLAQKAVILTKSRK